MMRIFFLILSFIAFSGCTAEKDQSAAPPVSTEKNLFQELRDRTVKDPRDAEAWFHLADLYDRSDMYQEEINALQKVITLDPKKGYAHAKLGTAYSRLGKHQEAIASYGTAIKLFPKNPVWYNNIAVSYGKMGKTDDEIAALEQAIALRPRYATARYNLGMALLRKGRRADAVRQYQMISTFDSGVATALKKELDRKEK
jgi:tetratricopeptide (TPR) repeat protein